MISRAIYTLLLWLGLPWILLRVWRRSRREPAYAQHLSERFGRIKLRSTRPVIWIHAVSVGEVRASAPLVQALLEALPHHDVLITCMTAAGRMTIGQVFGDRVQAAFLPYDFPFAVQRFLSTVQPKIAVMIETEVWFNLLAACRAKHIPVVLANARLSANSARAYARLAWLSRPAFNTFSFVCAQHEADALRLARLGAHRIQVLGNLKFDVAFNAAQRDAGQALREQLIHRRVVLLASTREAEEALLLDALLPVLPTDTLICIVPRHPQRFEEVAQLCLARGLRIARRSHGQSIGDAQVLLGDTMGEMAFYIALADVALMGGSFLRLGGQNLIEVCAQGVPVISGPHSFNFKAVTQEAARRGALIQVADANAAATNTNVLLKDAAQRKKMGVAGIALCQKHRGATQRHLDLMLELLSA